jgi:hypothetical protein
MNLKLLPKSNYLKNTGVFFLRKREYILINILIKCGVNGTIPEN